VNTELANKACAYLLIALTDATDTATKACAHLLITPINAIKANLFIYSIITKLCYIFTVFIKIMVDTSVFKKSTISYKQCVKEVITLIRLIRLIMIRLD
jgi:hypothetical protein